jgi:hypothetical protein
MITLGRFSLLLVQSPHVRVCHQNKMKSLRLADWILVKFLHSLRNNTLGSDLKRREIAWKGIFLSYSM